VGLAADAAPEYYRTIDVYRPSGWNSPGVKKAISIYWKTTLFIVKALIAIPLAIVTIGAFWLLGVIIMLFVSKA
jgi:hypothetical protein